MSKQLGKRLSFDQNEKVFSFKVDVMRIGGNKNNNVYCAWIQWQKPNKTSAKIWSEYFFW